MNSFYHEAGPYVRLFSMERDTCQTILDAAKLNFISAIEIAETRVKQGGVSKKASPSPAGRQKKGSHCQAGQHVLKQTL
jgi:hypothetical protein